MTHAMTTDGSDRVEDAGLVLASASPRRREILGMLGLRFRVVPSDVDETKLVGHTPEAYAERVACAKADAVVLGLGRESSTRCAPFVLAADTVVVVDGEALGKPADGDDARAMLARLAGREHAVVTAIALARVRETWRDVRRVETRVWFRPLSPTQIDAYVRSGEGQDKAGAYAAQGLGAALVTRIDGSYWNVVGLPAAETIDLLVERGALGGWP